MHVEEILRRPRLTSHMPWVQRAFMGRSVLISGAAGSIGSELARQVLTLGPRRVTLLDWAESALYLVSREIEAQLGRGHVDAAPWASCEVAARLVDVTEHARVRRIFAQERPDIVLHAAAYKHVPILEDHPSEAVRVNIGGTQSILDAAAATSVDRFVLVSTDKAVWPSSVMGSSKRIAEMLVADAARQLNRAYSTVRFGNVLGSSGSVVHIFREQLRRGEPLTITDAAMTRYFMTIPEATWLLLGAAALASPGDIFALDMGRPMKIMDLARYVAALAGHDPDRLAIEVVGLRKGEKLHEALFYDQEHVEHTKMGKVLRGRSTPPPADLRERVARLLALTNSHHEESVLSALDALVRESAGGVPLAAHFQPQVL